MLNGKNANKSIFVSSTFKDMQSERDALRDYVLPMVNDFAAKYDGVVELIDLRWGVDTASVSEAEQNHKVLRTCLDEIERSRPFFLGLIGDRYGWIPPQNDMQAALEAAQFSMDDFNKSVTALEIEYGTLRSDNPPVCLFYFRDSPDYSNLPAGLNGVYQDDAEGLARLASLKENIRTRFGEDVKNYAVQVTQDGLVVSRSWAEMVAADIIAKLREEWGEASETPPSLNEREKSVQAAFYESRTAYFAGRERAVGELTAFCLGERDSGPRMLMLMGEAGSGKSGLLCKVMDEIGDKCLLLPFCCGLSPYSSVIENMLRYFIAIICDKLKIEDESDKIIKFSELKDRFIGLLYAACEQTRVTIVVDALDQLSGTEARRMLWLGGELPDNMRLLCSIIDGPEVEAFRQWGGEARGIPAYGPEDAASIIRAIAARNHKQLGAAVVAHILEKQTPGGEWAAGNPLYLSLITQDLVMMDRYELNEVQRLMEDGLSQPEALARFMRGRIDATPGDAEGAYIAILQRLEKLIGQDFVRAVIGLIAVSRGGLRESDLTGALKLLDLRFNAADFSWLRQMLRGHLAQGDMQQWDFSHQSFRRAFYKEYKQEASRYSPVLAFLFYQSQTVENKLAVREVMYQLHNDGVLNPEHLPALLRETARLIADERQFSSVYAKGLADIYIGAQDFDSQEDFLRGVLAETRILAKDVRWKIARTYRVFLYRELPFLARGEYIRELLGMAVGILNDVPEPDAETLEEIAACERSIGRSYEFTGDYKAACGAYWRSVLICIKLHAAASKETGKHFPAAKDLRRLSAVFQYFALMLETTGETERAEIYYLSMLACERDLEIVEQFNRSHIKIHSADAYLEISRFYSRSGRDEDAKLYFYRAFGIFTSDGNRENSNYGESIDFYIHFAHRMANAKRGAMALPALMKAKALAERWYADTGAVFAQRWLYEIYNELGSFLVTQKRHNKAERGADYMRKAIELKRIVYTRTHDKRDDPDYMGYFRKLLEEYESQSEPLDTTSGNPPEEEYDYSDILHENPMMAGRDILIERYNRTGDPEALRELAYTLWDIARWLYQDGIPRMILSGSAALEAYPAYRAAVAAFAELTALTNDPEDIAALSAVEKQSGYKPAREADGSLIRFSDARWNYENYQVSEADGKGDYPRIDRPIVYLQRAYALAYSRYQAAPSAETKKDLANICLMLHRTAHFSERDKELTRDGITLEVCAKDMELLNEDAEEEGTLAAWVSFSAILDITAVYAVSVGISNEPENEETAKRLIKKACTVHEAIRDRWPSLEQRRAYAAFCSSFVIKLRGYPAEAERKHLAKEALGAWKDIYTETMLAADREARKRAIHTFNVEYSFTE